MGLFRFAELSVSGTRAKASGPKVDTGFGKNLMRFKGASRKRRCATLFLAGAMSLPINALPFSLTTPAAFAKGPESLADLSEKVSDAVVNISATHTLRRSFRGVFPPPSARSGQWRQ
jgi:serine protease Do